VHRVLTLRQPKIGATQSPAGFEREVNREIESAEAGFVARPTEFLSIGSNAITAATVMNRSVNTTHAACSGGPPARSIELAASATIVRLGQKSGSVPAFPPLRSAIADTPFRGRR
jgi:hypothetical protein